MPVIDSNSTNDLDQTQIEINGVDETDTNRAVGTRVMNSGEVALRTTPRFETEGADTPSVYVISKKYRVDSDATEVSLNNVNQSFTQLYSYSGSGKFFGFDVRLDDDSIIVKLDIDSETIFEIDCDILQNFADSSPTKFSTFYWDQGTDVITFRPIAPIKYDTSIEISAKANSGSNGRDALGYIVALTKET